MANISRCGLNNVDKKNVSRSMSESLWFEEQIYDRRLTYLNKETKSIRNPNPEPVLAIDDNLLEPVGSLFECVDRQYHYTDDGYPIAHNPSPLAK